MKRFLFCMLILVFLFPGCAVQENAQIAATTLPVYEFTSRLCEGTGITVTRLVTESVSCLHDYSVSVRQMRAIESAELIVMSGAGLEHFLKDLLEEQNVLDASAQVQLMPGEEDGFDPHFWLSPKAASAMVNEICDGLIRQYPQHEARFSENARKLLVQLAQLQEYGEQTLASVRCRQLITFHDGFGYFADAFDLEILEAVEEESGSEASASELKHLIGLVKGNALPAIFTEKSGSDSAAKVISAETGAGIFTLDMAMSGDSYFDAMYHNIDTIREALG